MQIRIQKAQLRQKTQRGVHLEVPDRQDLGSTPVNFQVRETTTRTPNEDEKLPKPTTWTVMLTDSPDLRTNTRESLNVIPTGVTLKRTPTIKG